MWTRWAGLCGSVRLSTAFLHDGLLPVSIRQLSLVLYHLPERITDGQFRILVYLADVADVEGRNVFPSPHRLAALTGFSVRTVRTALQKFQTLGWLRKVDVSNGVRRMTYQLTLPTPARVWKSCEDPEQNLLKSGACGASCNATSGSVGSASLHPTLHDLAASASAVDACASDPSSDPGSDPYVQEQSGAVAPPSPFTHRPEHDLTRAPSTTLQQFIARLRATHADAPKGATNGVATGEPDDGAVLSMPGTDRRRHGLREDAARDDSV